MSFFYLFLGGVGIYYIVKNLQPNTKIVKLLSNPRYPYMDSKTAFQQTWRQEYKGHEKEVNEVLGLEKIYHQHVNGSKVPTYSKKIHPRVPIINS